MQFYVLQSTITGKVYFDLANDAFEAQKACKLVECLNLFSSKDKKEAVKVYDHYQSIEKQRQLRQSKLTH